MKNKNDMVEFLRRRAIASDCADEEWNLLVLYEAQAKAQWESSKIPKWWHWLIEWCPKCDVQLSQGPVSDDIGEDCNLFAKVEAHNREKDCHCECGTASVMKYRHALADWNCITDADSTPIRKAKLLPDQSEGQGTFMTQAEYEARCKKPVIA